jgi:hypothetical protein
MCFREQATRMVILSGGVVVGLKERGCETIDEF